MKSTSLYLRVGLLVVAGVVLAVGFVIFLLGGRGGGPSVVFETYSTESVQGLDVGGPVRFRGVQVGRVTQIRLASAEYARPTGVAYSEAFQQVVIRFAIDAGDIGDVPTPERAIALGLRARIAAQGLTGVNYVELDFVDPGRFPMPALSWTPRFPVVPLIPSTASQVRGAAEQLAEQLKDVPLAQLARDLSSLLASLSGQLGTEGDVTATLRETALAMAQLRSLLQGGALEATLTDIRGTAEAARALAAAPELRQALNNASTAALELRRTAQRLPATVDGVERTLRTARDTTSDIQSELVPILADLRAATASLRATAESLRASPSQALFGAPPQPPSERRR